MKEDFSSPQINLSDKTKWYKTWNGEILIVGNVYKVGSEFYVYAGDFKSREEVPRVSCCFTIGDVLKTKRIEINTQQELPLKERKRRTDDDRPIDTTIKGTDNTLMILVKSVIQKKNITRGHFKEFYQNVSDMNNILRCIEKGENLSWTRFNDLIEKLNASYKLSVYDEDDTVIEETK
jgi:hypothetical protein